MAFGSDIWTWFDSACNRGNLPVMGAPDHGTWLGTLVFDGARAFEGSAPDLYLHCIRIIRPASAMGMDPGLTADQVEALRGRVSRNIPVMHPSTFGL